MNEEILKDVEKTSGDDFILSLRIKKEGVKIKLHLKAAKVIEDIFQSEQIEASSVYMSNGDPLKFYVWSEKNEGVKNEFREIILNRFGSELKENNYSLLRTVGLSEGIIMDINTLISEEYLTAWATGLKEFIIKLYRRLVSDCEINLYMEKKEVR